MNGIQSLFPSFRKPSAARLSGIHVAIDLLKHGFRARAYGTPRNDNGEAAS
jgi:hypothetical protein